MKINFAANSPSFTHALCRQDEERLKNISKEALEHLGIDRVSVTFFDFAIPHGEYNTGIGTIFSKEGIDTAEFANTYFGMTNLQTGPQGEISNFVRSPYSGTNFSLGMQNISPEKLTQAQYGKILTKNDLKKSNYMNSNKNDEFVDYEHVFSDTNGIKPLLLKAYKNFRQLPDNSEIKREFEDFKSANTYWLERDSVYEALAFKYGNNDFKKWSFRDQNVYADENNIDKSRIEELKQMTDKDGNNIVEFNEFIQFIADKQQRETKNTLNNMGITLGGDCQIGFADKEIWAHKSAFYEDETMFGCDKDGDGKFITCWTQAPDMNKLDGEAGRLYHEKFKTMFKRYNTIRVDAAWQLVYPTLVKPDKKDDFGNMRGSLAANQPEVEDKIINIIKNEAKKAGIDESGINLEFLDGAGKGWKSLNNKKVKKAAETMNCIQTMQYMSKGWGYPEYYRSDRAGVFKHPFEISIGTHDDKPAREIAQNMTHEQVNIISKNLKRGRRSFLDIKQRTAALFAMLFTNTPKNPSDPKGRVSMTVVDAVGSDRRINVPNTQEGNWEFRLGKNWQEEYFKKLSQGIGFNLPEALSAALKAKEHPSNLTDKLDKYADALKSPYGPMTREEAECMVQQGNFMYVIG